MSNLSEEEKERIERLKKWRDNMLKGTRANVIHNFCNDIDILLNLLEKQQKEIKELEEDNAELRRLKNKLSIATAIALGGRKIPISKKTLNELNDMFSIEIEYRPFYDDYVFYAK